MKVRRLKRAREKRRTKVYIEYRLPEADQAVFWRVRALAAVSDRFQLTASDAKKAPKGYTTLILDEEAIPGITLSKTYSAELDGPPLRALRDVIVAMLRLHRLPRQ